MQEPEMKALLQKTLDALLKGVLPPADDKPLSQPNVWNSSRIVA